jgi:uncharacterized membrane protein
MLAIFIAFRVNVALKHMNSDPPQQQIEDLPAVFTGVMPCADCPGIEYTLSLRENRFTELSYYLERGEELFEIRGNWELRNDTLKLFRDEGELHKAFLYSRESIELIDRDLQRIVSDFEDSYQITRAQEKESIQKNHDEHRSLGIDFLASGNEPFWHLRADLQGTLYFRTPETEIDFPSFEIEDEAGRDIIYRSENDTETIQVTITPGYCRDSMSGFLFTHRVTVETPDNRSVSGCGRFLQ